MQKEGIVPISMSHAVFYPMYKKIFGLSGTVGSEDDRDELKLVYELCAFDMPTNLPCLRRDAPARTVASKEELHAQALKQIEECREAGRPILVLCRSIKKTEELKEILDRKEIPCKLLNENQKESEKEVLEGAGLPGAVTIATNVAGRGTDIKLNNESKENGGLHVLLTFQPHSQRVEWQARGRAGRQGDRGSSEVVSLGGQKLGSTPQERIKRAKMERACHVLVEAFYARISAFEQSLVKRGRLNALVVELGNRQLKNRPQPVEKMHEKDRILGEQAIELLCSSEASEAAWRALLQLIVKRVKERAITRWYCDFYQDVIDGGYEGTIAEMRALFTKHMKEQEVRLDPLGRGLIAYLREVTGAKLPHVGPSSELK